MFRNLCTTTGSASWLCMRDAGNTEMRCRRDPLGLQLPKQRVTGLHIIWLVTYYINIWSPRGPHFLFRTRPRAMPAARRIELVLCFVC